MFPRHNEALHVERVEPGVCGDDVERVRGRGGGEAVGRAGPGAQRVPFESGSDRGRGLVGAAGGGLPARSVAGLARGAGSGLRGSLRDERRGGDTGFRPPNRVQPRFAAAGAAGQDGARVRGGRGANRQRALSLEVGGLDRGGQGLETARPASGGGRFQQGVGRAGQYVGGAVGH